MSRSSSLITLNTLVIIALLVISCSTPPVPTPTVTPLPTATFTPIPTLTPMPTSTPSLEQRMQKYLAALGLKKCEQCTLTYLDNGTEVLTQQVINKDGKVVSHILAVMSKDGIVLDYKTAKAQAQNVTGKIDGEIILNDKGEIAWKWDVDKQEWVVKEPSKILFEKNYYQTEEQLRATFSSVDCSAHELRGPSNQRFVFYARGPGFENFQNRYSVDMVRVLLLTRVRVEELKDGKQIAHFLFLHRKTKENNPFMMRVSVPLEQVIVSQSGTPGIDSLKNLPKDKWISTLENSLIPKLDLFRIKMSSPVTKTGVAAQPTLNDSIFRVFSVGYQSFVKTKIGESGFKPYKDYEEFMSVVVSQWKSLTVSSSLDESAMFQLLSRVGNQWADSSYIPEFSLPDSIYIEPIFSIANLE